MLKTVLMNKDIMVCLVYLSGIFGLMAGETLLSIPLLLTASILSLVKFPVLVKI